MRLYTWNVNGLRACMGKGFPEFVQQAEPDILCLQETKLQPDQLQLELPGYEIYWNSAERKGYSGTAVLTRIPPLNIRRGIGSPEHDQEGRALTAEFPQFYLVNSYTPNAQRELARLDFRMAWEDRLREYLLELAQHKPVILCGDLNVAHQEIDLKNPGPNRGNAGFSDQEREKMTQLLEAGFVDAFRYLYPEKTGAYSWWSYLYKARERNAGWRIDYFILSQSLLPRLVDCRIHSEVFGSDHCPVELELSN